MRKKTLSLIFVFIIIFIATSCGRKNSISKDNVTFSNDEDGVIYGADGYGETYSVNEFGILYTKNNLICYCDIDTGETYALCGKSNCSHSNENCTAWYKEQTDINGVAFLGEKIYLLRKNYENNSYELLQMDVTGNNQKVICKIDIGSMKEKTWVLTSIENVYYCSGNAILETNYMFVSENTEDKKRTELRYYIIDLTTGIINEIKKNSSEESSKLTLIGISDTNLIFQECVNKEKLLSEDEFKEGYEHGEFDDISATLEIDEAYFEYESKWYPKHCNPQERYIRYDIIDSKQIILEEGELLITFDEEGYELGELPRYTILGSYDQKYVVCAPNWEMKGEKIFLWDVEKNEKMPVLEIDDGGCLSWETGRISQAVFEDEKFLYCEYIDENSANIYIYNLKEEKKQKLYEDERNISFRIIDDTEDSFIGKKYSEDGYNLYIILKDDYYEGNINKAQKLKL